MRTIARNRWSLVVALALAVVAMAGLSRVTLRGAGAEPVAFSLSVDCDVLTPGIQDACVFPSGTTDVDVDIVLTNGTDADVTLGSHDFFATTNESVLDPKPGSADPLNSNPDVNEQAVAEGWNCGMVSSPDNNADPLIATSAHVCFGAGLDFPTLSAGQALPLARVRYTASEGAAIITLSNVQVSDETQSELFSCAPVQFFEGTCSPAYVQIGETVGTSTPAPPPSSTATVTPTDTVPPTSTATPTITPTPIPANGGVSAVLGLNQSVCIVASILYEGIGQATAVTRCRNAHHQPYLQDLVECIYTQCSAPGLIQPGPEAFATIDLDADQVHPSLPMTFYAFVDGDYPVEFETSVGQFLMDGVFSETYVCDTATEDPDCDASTLTQGDGVVAAHVWVEPGDEGPATVTVTQNGVSVVAPFQVYGVPASITFEFVGQDFVATGSTPPQAAGGPPLETACDVEPLSAATTGVSAPQKTIVIMRVRDALGNALTGSIVRLSPAWDTSFSDDPAWDLTPQGAAALPVSPAFDLGAAGAGFPQVICGGDVPGPLTLSVDLHPVFDPIAPDIDTTFTVPVLELPDDDRDFVTDGADNCPGVANTGQENADADLVVQSPPRPFDDLTWLNSDVAGDACDDDDDNDGLPDAAEAAGAPCASASGPTNPLLLDSDGDRYADGAECLLSSDPASSASTPAAPALDSDGDDLSDAFEVLLGTDPGDDDSDDDGLRDGIEVLFYGSDPLSADSDADGCDDLREAASLDRNRVVGASDLGLVAGAFGPAGPGETWRWNADIDKNGVVGAADLGLAAIAFGRCGAVD